MSPLCLLDPINNFTPIMHSFTTLKKKQFFVVVFLQIGGKEDRGTKIFLVLFVRRNLEDTSKNNRYWVSLLDYHSYGCHCLIITVMYHCLIIVSN